MEATVAYSRLKQALRQRNVLVVVNVGLGLAILLMAWYIATRSTHIILTPTLVTESGMNSKTPGPEYLEQVTRDVATLFLNRHPHNLSYFRQNILRLADPAAHGEIEAALIATERKLLATKTSTIFYPSEIFVDPTRLYSEIRGELHTFLGPDRVRSERKIFAAEWSYTALRLQLKDFYPIEPKETKSATTAMNKGGDKP